MLIALSGRAGSGKDTVGEIVQYLTSDMCRIDNFTFQEWLNYGKTKEQYEHKWEIKKFAGKLKIIGSMLSGVPVEYFEDQEFKKQEMSEEWWYWSNTDKTTTKIPYTEQTKILAKSDSDIVLYKTTYREFLQKLGTEAMRDGLHTNVWVNALFADYKELSVLRDAQGIKIFNEKGEHQFNYPNWILTDMRFPNEMEAVELREGITIRVVRSFNHKMGSKETGTLDLTPLHSSETALDDAKFDYTIENDGTLDELVEKVRAILTKEKMI